MCVKLVCNCIGIMEEKQKFHRMVLSSESNLFKCPVLSINER